MTLATGAPDLALTGESAEQPRSAWSKHRGAVLVGVVFVLLALYYNISIPLWESDNEWGHYNYVRYLLVNNAIPVPGSEMLQPASDDQCGALSEPLVTSHQLERQPPLYYMLGALSTFWIDADHELTPATNPFLLTEPWRNGYNFAVHTAAEDFPYQGTSLAVHIIRFMSTLVGLAGLLAVYLTGLLIFPGRRYLALAIMAFTAFLPQYVFSASVVNNDIMAAALGFWCVFFCVYALLQKGSVLVLAAAAGMAMLAMLAKYAALPLIGLVAAVVIIRMVQVWKYDREHFSKMLWQTALLFALVTVPLLIWFGRNLQFFDQVLEFYTRLIGAFTGSPSAMSDTGKVVEPKAPLDFVRAAQYAFITFWGMFGWDAIVLPTWVVTLLAAMSLVAVAGVVRCLVDRNQPRTMRLLVLGAVIFLVATWAISAFRSLGTSEPRGRYLLPAYSAATFLLVYGIHEILPRRLRKGGLAVVCGGMLILAVAVPVMLLRPIYAPPVLAASADLLPGESPVNATFGDFAELVGYSIEPQELRVWDTVRVTLVWRVLKEVSDNYTVSVLLLDGAKESHGVTAHFPGRGNYATSLWQPGDVFRDTYELQLQPSARERLPSLGQVKVTMYCYPGEDYVLVSDSQGAALGDALYIGRMKWLPGQNAVLAQDGGDPLVIMNNELALRALTVSNLDPLPGQELAIDLTWEVLQAPGRDYTVFAHLIDRDGVQVGGNDQPMTGGLYPTGLWAQGEVVTHTQQLRVPVGLPAGEYDLLLGVYDPMTGERLAVRTAAGVELPDGALEVATLTLSANSVFIPSVQIHKPENQ